MRKFYDDKLLRYLGDSLEWVNFSVDEKDVVYQGLDFEGFKIFDHRQTFF